MPWDAILGGASGGIAVAIVVAVFFLKSLAGKIVEAAQRRFDSALTRAEDLHRSTVAMASTVDTDLRARRIAAYAELWKQTGALPQWPRNRELEYQDLSKLTDDFRRWYFETGGMYLSTRARSAYGEVQESLASVLEDGRAGKVSDSDYDAVRRRCSVLRTELTRDLLSRREAPELKDG